MVYIHIQYIVIHTFTQGQFGEISRVHFNIDYTIMMASKRQTNSPPNRRPHEMW